MNLNVNPARLNVFSQPSLAAEVNQISPKAAPYATFNRLAQSAHFGLTDIIRQPKKERIGHMANISEWALEFWCHPRQYRRLSIRPLFMQQRN